MKVIFLDCDGVLNMHGSGGFYTLNKARLRLLEKIVKDTDAKIVVSSTWRNSPTHMKKLMNALGYRGMKVIGVTDRLGLSSDGERYYRGHEIQKYLDEHPEIEQFVILDDDSDMLDSQLRNFIQTDGKIGLTETLAYRAMYILNNGPNSIKEVKEKPKVKDQFEDLYPIWMARLGFGQE